LTEKDLDGGLCPNHATKPKWLTEENYFFALSKYQERLLDHIEKNPEFILPEIRKNEIVSLLKEGLRDISVSRSSFDWGVALPNDPDHVVYVWFDALINYITAVGYGWDEAEFKKWWPTQMHVIGKDITRFHCIIWPAMLMSAGIELPKTIFGHGFVYLRGEKMSKSLGNVVTPMDVIDRFGADPLRFYLMREGGFGRDSDFTWEHFIERYNGDLANGIGNLVARTIGMAKKYQDGIIRPPSSPNSDIELSKAAIELPGRVFQALDHTTGEVAFHVALGAIWEVVATADRYINDTKPWALAKEGKAEEINDVLWSIASAIRVMSIMLAPFIPQTAEKIWSAMGFEALGSLSDQTFDTAGLAWGAINSKITTKPGEGLFPRIEEKKVVDKEKKVEPKAEKKKKEKKMENTPGIVELIDIMDFAKIELRVAEIVEADAVEGADKLLRLQVNLGNETRQIVAGIAQHYEPTELVGKKVVVVANLKPIKLRGVESQGMLLAASDKETVSIVTPLNDVATGSKVK
jgi:methionyl-tRNA synthetase